MILITFQTIAKAIAQFPDQQVKIFEKSGHLLQLGYQEEFETVYEEILDDIG